MVSVGQHSRRGAGGLGCLVSLVLFAAALYYGVNIGQVYLRYHHLMDGMRSQARLAPGLHDDIIYRRLEAHADSLIPGVRPAFRIIRERHLGRIVIETEYSDQVDLPFFKHTFVMHPRAKEQQ